MYTHQKLQVTNLCDAKLYWERDGKNFKRNQGKQ